MDVSAVNGIQAAGVNCDCGAKKCQHVKQTNLEYQPLVDEVCFTKEAAPAQEGKKKASVAKKIGVGVASYFVPGLGQLINGQGKKALAFFGGTIAAGALTFACPPLGIAAALGVGIGSIVDAVKNA